MTDKKPGTGKIVGAAVAVVLAIAALFVGPWEGRRLVPYQDVVNVWTVCDGHTGTVPQRRYTDPECDALLRQDLGVAHGHVRRCIRVPMPVYTEAAFTSAAFNLGPQVVCGSTLQRKANAGDLAGACRELTHARRRLSDGRYVEHGWTYAGGKRYPGLIRRRTAERALCEGREVPLP